ncbi:Rab GTPase domain-containing protein [Reticulomyxa filosa]|uniref:Rab GTPase domain-containing protein n=1 Tax=Reticulomyxa filosa TaxID=46433 RepID=X6M7Q8_RETFI|nr:Rab GTPase domain-containing protein [Reticulomyxa filosa]|eukprot:ETO09686.1 Rab GTPase domain-containing protein [Reticulomyxa filosa]
MKESPQYRRRLIQVVGQIFKCTNNNDQRKRLLKRLCDDEFGILFFVVICGIDTIITTYSHNRIRTFNYIVLSNLRETIPELKKGDNSFELSNNTNKNHNINDYNNNNNNNNNMNEFMNLVSLVTRCKDDALQRNCLLQVLYFKLSLLNIYV